MKKRFTSCIAAVLLCASLSVSAASYPYLRGDADGNGAVSVMDATAVQRVLAELDDDPGGLITLRGNVNGKGLDISDATAIQRYLAEYDNELRIGETVSGGEDDLPFIWN